MADARSPGNSTHAEQFAAAYPDRFLMFIAEQHAYVARQADGPRADATAWPGRASQRQPFGTNDP